MPRDMQQVDRLRKIVEEMDKICEKTGEYQREPCREDYTGSRDEGWNE